MDVAFALPQDQAPAIQARLHSSATIPVVVRDRARTQTLATGRLLTLDNQIDVTTGTIKAKARFGNGDGALIPNQFVNVDVTVNTVAGVAIAPTASVRHGPQGDFVYVVDDKRTAHVRPIKTGPAAGEQVAVLSGLEPGEKVVTEGADRLTDGGKVMLPGDRRGGGRGAGNPGPAGADGQGRHGGWRHRIGGQGGAPAGGTGGNPGGASGGNG